MNGKRAQSNCIELTCEKRFQHISNYMLIGATKTSHLLCFRSNETCIGNQISICEFLRTYTNSIIVMKVYWRLNRTILSMYKHNLTNILIHWNESQRYFNRCNKISNQNGFCFTISIRHFVITIGSHTHECSLCSS